MRVMSVMSAVWGAQCACIGACIESEVRPVMFTNDA